MRDNRHVYAVALMLVALTLVTEPLLCILHCTLWLSLTPAAPLHAHQHQMVIPVGSVLLIDGMAMGKLTTHAADSSALPSQTRVRPGALLLELSSPLCFTRGGPGQGDIGQVAQPFHEFLLQSALALSMLWLCLHQVLRLSAAAATRQIRPPLRPPILPSS